MPQGFYNKVVPRIKISFPETQVSEIWKAALKTRVVHEIEVRKSIVHPNGKQFVERQYCAPISQYKSYGHCQLYVIKTGQQYHYAWLDIIWEVSGYSTVMRWCSEDHCYKSDDDQWRIIREESDQKLCTLMRDGNVVTDHNEEPIQGELDVVVIKGRKNYRMAMPFEIGI